MRTRHRWFAALVGVAFLSLSIQRAALAGVIDTEEYLHTLDREATIEHIDSVLAPVPGSPGRPSMVTRRISDTKRGCPIDGVSTGRFYRGRTEARLGDRKSVV